MVEERILPRIRGPHDLRSLEGHELARLASELRERLKEVVNEHGGHLASNLGVVELTIALHSSFDFLFDRLVWDTSHQSYCHKLLTGRNDLFGQLRQYQGCCGFASKEESPYDLFDAGHAGTSVSAGLGIAVGERSQGRDSRTVVVIGDASVAAGMALEGLNHCGDLRENLIVILNDNSMSIDVSVGALSRYLNRIRSGSLYRGLKRELHVLLPRVPLVGKPIEEGLEHIHDVIHHALVPGQIFEDFGFRYFGPVNGHDLDDLVDMLGKLRTMKGPVLLHVLTNKGHGWAPAQEDPIKYHASRGFLEPTREPELVEPAAEQQKEKRPSYTEAFRDALIELAAEDTRIHAITAAMPGGTGLGEFQKRFADRYYDVGIAEQHGTTFASGLAFTGLRPVFGVYSTFLQRGFDQVIHDVCLQGNPVVFALDRAGLVEDGPTHQGVFDIAYLRCIPTMGLMAPADAEELQEMLRLSVERDHPVAIRYPKCEAPELSRQRQRAPLEWGKAEVLRAPQRLTLLAYGSMVEIALHAADALNDEWHEERGETPVGVVNMRFAKPVDAAVLRTLAHPDRIVITLEEHTATGGFGSAVLEAVHDLGLLYARLLVWGVPDRFMAFGARTHLLHEIELDAEGIIGRLRDLLPERHSRLERPESPVSSVDLRGSASDR